MSEPNRAAASSRVAWSIDGASFQFVAPIAQLAQLAPLGGYVQLTVERGRAYLGQIISQEVTGTLDAVQGTGRLLGRLGKRAIVSTTWRDVFERANLSKAEEGRVVSYFAGGGRRSAMLDIGKLSLAGPSARAELRASGFNRHTFLCGQSGSGKTSAMRVILERLLLETELRILIIDPNGDFVKLGRLRRRKELIEKGSSGVDEDGPSIADRYVQAVKDLRVFSTISRRGEALRIRFNDLSAIGQIAALRLDPLDDREEFNAGYRIAEGLERQGTYSLQAVIDELNRSGPMGQTIRMRIENLGLLRWSIWSEGDDQSLIDVLSGEWRAMVLDVSQLWRPGERPALVLAVLEDFWRRRRKRRPVLIAIDEAHTVCPPQPKRPVQTRTMQHLVRIAGEGRKFGLHLLLATQRPDKIHPNVLSLCDNLVLMRVNSAADLAYIAQVFAYAPRALVELASEFRLGQGLIAGQISPAPIITRFERSLSQEAGGDASTRWARRRGST